MQNAGVVIVGASVAGITAAETLRNEGYKGLITVIGQENHLPYNRPPLSKQILIGKWQGTETFIYDSKKFDDMEIRFILGEKAVSLDCKGRTVSTTQNKISFEDLIIATGMRVRRIENTQKLQCVHVLRTIDDALRLRAALKQGLKVAVVGAGVLGSEIASAMSAHGCEVTVLDRMNEPQLPLTGGHLSAYITRLFDENGVQYKFGVGINEIVEKDSKVTIALSDDSTFSFDIVVVAIGCVPNIEWLEGSGLDISNGVLCDSNGMAAPHIYAVGDVARWTHQETKLALRRENQTSAIEQGIAVGRYVSQGEISSATQPFFWSELFGNKILLLGNLEADSKLEILQGSLSENIFLGATVRNGITTGLVGWNMAVAFRKARAIVGAHGN